MTAIQWETSTENTYTICHVHEEEYKHNVEWDETDTVDNVERQRPELPLKVHMHGSA